jgi:glutamyl-tRNA reductase
MVVGLNYRTAPVAVRERFCIDENRRYRALLHLSGAEGIEEVIVLSTCNRTEFYLWASDVTLAANSVMRLLGADYGLKLQEWKHFYRLLDEAALLHIFRVISRLDSMVFGAPQIVPQAQVAWQQAQKVGASARFLDAIMQKAFAVSERVNRETAIAKLPASIPHTAVELSRQIFGSLANRKVLILGAGEMSELCARELLKQSPGHVSVINRTFEHAVDLTAKLGGAASHFEVSPFAAFHFEDRWQHLTEADIIISSSSCPNRILSREEAERLVSDRKLRAAAQPLLIVDLAMPRDIDPAVRYLDGILLYDLDDLENVEDHARGDREAIAAEAHKIFHEEVQGFCRKLISDTAVPTIVQVRERLGEVCRQELDAFREENGPFSKDQDEMLNAVLARMTKRIAASLARELKEVPEKTEQEQMTQALQRLFHLQNPNEGIARSKSAQL